MSEPDYRKLSYYRTTVPIYKSQNEIRSILQKFNLTGIRFTEKLDIKTNTLYGVIEFTLLKNNKELMFRFMFLLPKKDMLQKQVYRCLFHYLKNRFMAIEFGITTVEKEFLQDLVLKLPDGTTSTVKEIVGDNVLKLQYNDLKLLEE